MKALHEYKNCYFIGIGGIGMSALAQYFLQIGKNVAGYDRTPTEITQMLENKGIIVHFEDNLKKIPPHFFDKETTLIVFTPAVKELSELEYFIEHNFDVLKRSQVLGRITESSYCFAVAGTHGKTTTSSILAHILYENNANMSAFLGGISENFNSNLVLNGSEQTVVEADEFDRSFLQLSPNIACITAIDSDHLDIYGSEEEFRKGFEAFTQKIKKGGKLIVRKGVPFQGLTYAINEAADYQIEQLRKENGRYVFDINFQNAKEIVKNCVLEKPGHHNLLNALAAVAMAHQSGYPLEGLGKALASFKGVKRRFSYQINIENKVFIDDYAHHPTELNALYQAAYDMHQGKPITIVFQPHLYTRTRDFAQEFAQSLSRFDRVVLLDIYPARELPIEGVSSKWLFDMIESPNKILLQKENLLDWIRQNPSPVLITAGAGDIGELVQKIKNILQNNE